MQPADAPFHADRAGQEVCVVSDSVAGFLGGYALDGKVAGLAEDVARKVDAVLLSDQLAAVTAQAALSRSGMVAGHGELEDVAADHQKAGEVLSVQELPGALAPFAEGVLTHQLANLEELVQVFYYLVSVKSHFVRVLWLGLSSFIARMIFSAVSLSAQSIMVLIMSTTFAAELRLLW